jgi:hypothetical protein
VYARARDATRVNGKIAKPKEEKVVAAGIIIAAAACARDFMCFIYGRARALSLCEY